MLNIMQNFKFDFLENEFWADWCVLNLGMNSQSYSKTQMESARNSSNYTTNWLTRTLILLPSKSLNSKKQTKLHQVTLPSAKTKTTFLAVVSHSLSTTTWSSKSYNPSKKQVWISYPFVSTHHNHYGWRYTTYTSPTPKLSKPTLIQTLSIHPLIP